MANGTELSLHVRCLAAPPPSCQGEEAEFGLQDADQCLHPGVVQPDGSLLFTVPLRVEMRDDLPRFLGPFAHGAPKERFLYLSYRPRVEGAPWIGRMKLPLKGITASQVEAALRGEGVLIATVAGCRWGSVPLADGWQLASME